MNRRHISTVILASTLFAAALPATSNAQEKGPQSQRVENLLKQMTIDEKIGQVVQADMNALKDKSDVQKYCLGSVLSGGSSDPPDITGKGWLVAVEEFKSYALKTRLKIPLLYGIDAVHGHNNVDGAVMFPHNIGMGAAHNPKLAEAAARVTAEEVAGTGIRWVFAPCVAVAQNASWGRTYESFGSSPDLVSKLGAAEVRGFQGRDLSDSSSVLACVKHFLADGGTQDGIDQGNTVCDEATLRRLFLPPYIAAVKAGAGSVMVSYSSWQGKKMHGNKYLITDVLKGELGFKGFVVSDWAAIDQISTNYEDDIAISMNAGLDMVMIPYGSDHANNYVQFIQLLKGLVASGRVPEARIDDAVRRILGVKFRLGLFDHPETDPALTASIGSDAHRQVARECVRQSLVLLKNSHKTLPLSKKIRHLQVVGIAADDLGTQCGGWTIDWQGRTGEVTKGGTTILAAIRKTVGPDTDVKYSADGVGIGGADAVIVVIGEKPYAEMKGDRKDLTLDPAHVALVRKAKDAGVPVVTVFLSGRPLKLGGALEASDAFVAAWLPGTEGQGVTDVLFGDYKPTGKLPRVWPADDQGTGVTTVAAKLGPLFASGYGLTY